MPEASGDIRPTIVSKLSVKSLGCDPTIVHEKKAPVALARFWGIAESTKITVNRQSGDTNIALTGNFQGQNLQTGEIMESGVLYLPAGIHDQLTGPIERMKNSKDAQPIKFAIEIAVVPANNPVKYSYTGKPLLKQEGIDPLADLRSEVSVKALPKPEGKK